MIPVLSDESPMLVAAVALQYRMSEFQIQQEKGPMLNELVQDASPTGI